MKRFSVFLIIMSVGLSSIFATTVYKASATASYYAGDFHGKKTSNGEIFNMWAMTCAHKKLPFNTILKVTNLANGKNVQVRVNDRGPFVADREIDLSKAELRKSGLKSFRLGHTQKKVFRRRKRLARWQGYLLRLFL